MFAIRVNRLLISASVAVVLLVGCKGHGSSSSIPQTDTNWTWEAGSNAANSTGNYVSIGSATTTGLPSGRSGAMSWLDSSGQFWVFSGAGAASDMWSFNISTLEWTWVAGNSYLSYINNPTTGIYGTQNVAAATNIPGQRAAGSTWVDGSGNLWMFGGYGTDANGLSGYLNDLWSFSPSTKWWTWQGGGTSAGNLAKPASWGTLNVASPSNQPNPRSNAAQWTSGGKFYMFGGQGYLSSSTGFQNDMWTLDPVANVWTWIGGSSSFNPLGTYSGQGTYQAASQPGGRQSATTWTDAQGNFWMFGGSGVDSAGSQGFLSDLWKYSPAQNQWAWMNGSTTVNALGVYGTNAVASSTNTPGARYGGVGWVDASGNLWLYGGYGINVSGNVAVMNDLWEYLTASQQWVWVNGSYYGDVTGLYGTIGVLSVYNMPGSRYGASAWKDPSTGNFWMYGGNGYDAGGTNGRLSDVWKFEP